MEHVPSLPVRRDWTDDPYPQGILSINWEARFATLIANGGTNGGDGGWIRLLGYSIGEEAQVKVFGMGTPDLTEHDPEITIGSLEGDGIVYPSGHALTIGKKNLSTNFSGVSSATGRDRAPLPVR